MNEQSQSNKEIARDIVVAMIEHHLIVGHTNESGSDAVVKAWEKVVKAVADSKE